MNCVNNCLMMSNTLDAQEIALERLKNVLVIFEKKKRNLDKRKNKLDEYKKKKDLNEDQQMAVSKYQEVVSNLELVDELNTLALQQIKDAEKALKKVKKQEKLESKRHEASLIEFVMKTYYMLERIFENQKVLSKLMSEKYMEVEEMNLLKELFNEIHISEKGNWKRCSEQLQSLFDGGSKPLDFVNTEDHALKYVPKDDLLKCVEKISTIDWLTSNTINDFLDKVVEHEEVGDIETEEVNISENTVEITESQQPVSNKEIEVPIEKHSVQPENTKLNFVFLHESLVQEDGCSKSTENGYESGAFNDEHMPRSNSQMSGKSVGNSNPNNAWNVESENAVDDVFSSATQSEFMHSENSRNLKTRGQRQPTNGRFRGRVATQTPAFSNRDAPPEALNYWKSNNRGSFNPNPRYPRSSRGRGRGRGNGRPENRQANDEILTSM